MKTKVIMSVITAGLIALVIIASLTNSPSDNGSTIDDVVFEDGIVNIYYFWQEGCAHCDAQFEFFERIEADLGSYFNLFSFEIASNPDNARLLGEVSELVDTQVTGVPFTVIGEEVFIGFNEGMEDDFTSAIVAGVDSDFDVVRDIIE